MAAAPGGSSWSATRFMRWTVGITLTSLVAMWYFAGAYEKTAPAAFTAKQAPVKRSAAAAPVHKISGCRGSTPYHLKKGEARVYINPTLACQVRFAVDQGEVAVYDSYGDLIVTATSAVSKTEKEVYGVANSLEARSASAKVTVTLCSQTAKVTNNRTCN